MRKPLLLLVLLISLTSTYAQQIETDKFNDLKYSSKGRDYTAKFEKNIFEDLIFTDNHDNNVTFEKKYLQREYPGIHADKFLKTKLFRDLIRQYRREHKYRATYKIDIFDQLIIEDNRGYKLSQGKDIFGHEQFEEELHGVRTSIKRNLRGGLEYKSGSENASLHKDIFGKWIYEDSLGNKFQFAPSTWDKLIRRLRTDQEVFWNLINQFFTP